MAVLMDDGSDGGGKLMQQFTCVPHAASHTTPTTHPNSYLLELKLEDATSSYIYSIYIYIVYYIVLYIYSITPALLKSV